LQVAKTDSLDDSCSNVACATDASLAVIEMAISHGANLLIVHHGLSWTLRGVPIPSGDHIEAKRVKTALEGNLAILALHLPMDAHPTLGNNARLCEGIGGEVTGHWFTAKGIIPPTDHGLSSPSSILEGVTPGETWPEIVLEDSTKNETKNKIKSEKKDGGNGAPTGRASFDIGIIAERQSGPAWTRTSVGERLAAIIGMEQTIGDGVRLHPETDLAAATLPVERLAICSGAAGGAILEAAAAGCDTLLSGEAPAHATILAEEAGVGLLLGGHHATETVGPKALAAWLSAVAEDSGLALNAYFLSRPIGL
jgi:putative NIF3 family GTP cyclohydrolase 1 type 2